MSWILKQLRKHIEDRGMMANLRCVLVYNKKHRAWPALNRLGVPINDEVLVFIAGLFALHPEETSMGNLGTTCKAIQLRHGEKTSEDKKELTPTERRFQHLMAAERDELYSRVLRMVLMAKSQDVPINYEQLQTDLRFWNDGIKIKWATAFWTPGTAPAIPIEEDV